MTPILKDYRTAKAPGAIFAIVMTLGVNIGLFAVLGWVNRRPAHLDKAAAIIKVHPLKLETVPPVKQLKKEFKIKKDKAPRKKQIKPRLKHRLTTRPPALKRPSVTPQQIAVNLTLPEMRFAPTVTTLIDATPSASAPGLVHGDGIADESEVDTPPRPIYSPSPHYPLSARRLGYTGNVKLGLVITHEGKARELRVIHSSGHRALDDSALRTVRTWRFEPAVDDGVQVDVRGMVQINFQIDRK